MATNLERIAGKHQLIDDLVKQQQIVNHIIDGLEAAKITDETTVKDLIDAICSTDDETALELFDIEEFDTVVDDPEGYH